MYLFLLTVHIFFGLISLLLVSQVIYSYITDQPNKQLKRYNGLIILTIIEFLTGLTMQFISPASLLSVCGRFGIYMALIATGLYLVKIQLKEHSSAQNEIV